jgi:hypothetical protein
MADAFFHMKLQDIGYLIAVLIVASITIIALVFVSGKRILKNPKYTRLISTLLILTFFHTIANPVMYFFYSGTPHFGWAIWVVSIFGNGTANMLLISQIELLGVFSTLCPFWKPNRVLGLKVLTVFCQVLATLPSYIYPVVYYVVNRNGFLFLIQVY